MKPSIEVKDGALHVGIDTNADGQNVADLKLNISEAIGEAFAKGSEVAGTKVAQFKFEGTKLVLKVDSDKDGQPVLELVVDLGEAYDEVNAALQKKQ
jgi:hypothetical protein